MAIRGIRLGSASAGIRQTERDDVAVIEMVEGTHTAAVFTQNAFCAAPVTVARKYLAKTSPRFLLINSGNANAGTGQPGIDDALATCGMLSKQGGCAVDEVLPFSTGVIGERLPVERFGEAIRQASDNLDASGWGAAARAIMTTDTVTKQCSKVIEIQGQAVTITGIAKGSGMIRPDMATMLAFVATDVAIGSSLLQKCLGHAVKGSFNRISVDGDTSTNDACVLMATGAADTPTIQHEDAAFLSVQDAVTQVCVHLAQAIVRDGEGATKFISLIVEGGASVQECLKVAYCVAHSPLVKTAFFAADPNWGRLLAAVGRAGVEGLDVGRVSMRLDDLWVLRGGEPAADYSESAGQRVMAQDEITVGIDLARGAHQATLWTCDLSYDYVRINADYRT